MALYHSVRGTNTYVLVGSPTIVNGIVSGFSSSNSVRWRPMNIAYAGSKIRVYFTASSAIQEAESLFHTQKSGGGLQYQVSLLTSSSGDFRIRLSATGSITVWDSTLHLSKNTEYYAEVECSATDIKFTVGTDAGGVLYSGNAATTGYASDSIYTCDIGYFSGGTALANAFVNMNKSFVVSNGAAWAGICPIEVKKHQLMGPVGYTITGSATVVDGILTNVANGASSYTNASVPNFETFEFVCKVRRPEAAFLYAFAFNAMYSKARVSANGTNYGTALFDYNNERIVTIPNSDFNIANANNQVGGWYIKLFVRKNAANYTYILSCSLDKQTWVSSEPATIEDNICYGIVYLLTNNSGAYQTQTMDLNETYIKVNGKLWYWQPRETEKIVVNGVEVWTKPSPEPTPSPAVIDANTYAVYHLDSDTSNSAQGSYTASSFASNLVTTESKFGAGCGRIRTDATSSFNDICSVDSDVTIADYTVDMWLNVKNMNNSGNVYFQLGQGSTLDTYYTYLGFFSNSSNEFRCRVNAGNNWVGSNYTSGSISDWHHIAWEVVNDDINFYCDGHKFYTLTGSTIQRGQTGGILKYRRWSDAGNVFIDELRTSNVARYNGNDFIPPTGPYEAAQ